MSRDPLDLAGLLAARFCHDLAGPVGALVNGAELIADEPDPQIRQEFIGMIASGAEAIGARVRFHRLAFGGPASDGAMQADEMRATLGGFLGIDRRLALDWQLAAGTLPRNRGRLLLALAAVAVDNAEGRGTLTVGDAAVRVHALRAALKPEVEAALGGSLPDAPPPSSTAAALFANALAARGGERIALKQAEGTLGFTILG